MNAFLRRTSLPCLLIAQTQVAFNDNAAKLMLIGLAQLVLPKDEAAVIISLLAMLLVLPFALFAPVVGWVADRFSKSTVLRIALQLQLGIMIWIVLSILARNLHLALVGFALLAIQASLFSPAKQGILKELVGSERLGVAVGWMEMLTVAAILIGGVSGGVGFDFFTRANGNDPWVGALQTSLLLGLGSILSILVFIGVRRTAPQSHEPFHVAIFWRHFGQLKELWQEKHLRLAALGIAYFYSLGGMIYLTLVQWGRELRHGEVGSVTQTGILLSLLGGGVAVGSLMAAALCRKRIELGLVPLGALGIAFSLAWTGFFSGESYLFYMGLIAMGVASGWFTVPLAAFLQDRAEENRRGTVLAATNLLTNLGGIAAVGVQSILAQQFGLTASQQFLLLILPSLVVSAYILWLLPESVLRLLIILFSRCIYRIRVLGLKNLPPIGKGALLVCNHISYVDAIILQVACPRPIRFVAYETFHKTWWIGWALRILQVIPISPRHAKEAIRTTIECLRSGELVCIFPEGELTRTGSLMGLRKGFERIARQGDAPVVPIWLDSLWGSIFSFSGSRYLWKKPERWPYPVTVSFGTPLSGERINSADLRQELLDQAEHSFQQRPELRGHLARACLRGLSKRPWKTCVIDTFPKRRQLSRGMMLALSIALSKRWKKWIPGKRVGVVLPPGIGGLATNLALVLAGKIPVNLNFTAGRSSLESCLNRSGIDTVISAEALRKKLTEFPWPEKTLDISSEINACGKTNILGWLAAVWILPHSILADWLDLPLQGDREEAGLLFTSGSSGEAKGVVLSHRNLLGNLAQIHAIGLMNHHDALMGCLPLFHSFGFTVTLWYPLVQGVRLITLPSPLEVKKIAETIHQEKATIFLGTPTFLRPYLRKAEPEQLRSLRMVIVGAEKLPHDLSKAFQERFAVPIYEGYGLTETSPVASVNLPDPPIVTRTAGYQSGNRLGSVGRLLPGITARILDPDSKIERTLFDVGLLHLRGPNIFEGYLHDSDRTHQVLREGWFSTGDLARFDEDGFLFIEGRLSRFSKIGGEMVPHGTVEQKIMEVFGFQALDTLPLVVTGIPDETKGEALVLLTTVEIASDVLREKLSSAGLSNLWIPKIIRRVEKIPTLASGKLDLKGCEALARS